MKNKIIIIYNGYSLIEQTKYKINRLVDEIKNSNLIPVVYSTLELFTDTSKSINFDDTLFAINLDKDYYLAKYLEKFIPIYNSSEATKICDDKMSTLLHLNNVVKIPKTISSPLCYQDKLDKNEADKFISYVTNNLSFPMVFKHCYGSLGKQVQLINNLDELKKVYYKSYMIPHIYEEYLSKHTGSDYRVIVIGNKVVAVMNRINNNDFRSNIYLGGKGVDVTTSVSNDIKDIAIKANKLLNLDYSGVDIMLDNNDIPTLLEVNSNPFFSEVEKVTKINITKSLIDYLISK